MVEALHKNTLDSAKAVGYQEVFFADFPDNRFDHVDLLDIVKVVEQMIEKLHPEIFAALELFFTLPSASL